MTEAEDRLVDEALRSELRSKEAAAPDFDVHWNAALREAGGTSRQSRWVWSLAPLAAAIGVLAVWLGFLGAPKENEPTPPAESERLISALTSTTPWEAPSDRLLNETAGLRVWGVPRLNWPALNEHTGGNSDET